MKGKVSTVDGDLKVLRVTFNQGEVHHYFVTVVLLTSIKLVNSLTCVYLGRICVLNLNITVQFYRVSFLTHVHDVFTCSLHSGLLKIR